MAKPPKEKAEFQIGWAVHQMKRDVEYRDIVVPRRNYSIVEFDAAGQEYRWMAIQSGDKTMLHLCCGDEDPHAFMACKMDTTFEYRELIAITKDKNHEQYRVAREIRQGGKVGNLSLQYRTSPKTYYIRARGDYGMDITMAAAEHGYFIYHKTYPGVRQYWNRAIQKARAAGYAETLAGRRVLLRGDWDGPQKWQFQSTAINYPIQGTGADQKCLALQELHPYVIECGARFMLDLHDGLYFEVPDGMVEQFTAQAKQMLDHLPYEREWGFAPPIQLPWDCKVGKSWGSLKEVK